MQTVCLNSVERSVISIKCQRMTLSFFKSYPCVNYYGFNEKKIWGKCFNANLRFLAGLPRCKCLGNAATCHISWFQAYEFACTL